MLREKAGEIPALESGDGFVFGFAQRIGSWRSIAGLRRYLYILRLNGWRVSERQRSGDDAFKLADVTWPRIGYQLIQSAGGERADLLAMFSGVSIEKVHRERNYIL